MFRVRYPLGGGWAMKHGSRPRSSSHLTVEALGTHSWPSPDAAIWMCNTERVTGEFTLP